MRLDAKEGRRGREFATGCAVEPTVGRWYWRFMKVGRRLSASAGISWLACAVSSSFLVACGDSEPEGQDGQALGGAAGAAARAGSASQSGQAGISGSGGTSGGGGTPGSGGSSSGGTNAGHAGSSVTGGSGGTAGAGAGGSSLARAIAASRLGTCALDGAGAIHCWGLAPEVWSIPGGSFVELYAGDNTICAVRADRSVACFTEPLGVTDTSYAPSFPVATLGVGLGTVCGTETNGDLFCNAASNTVAVPPPAAERASVVSAGQQFACALREDDGSVFCWGSQSLGSCDLSPPAGQLDAPSGSFLELASGPYSSCAIDVDGRLACWGLGKPGQEPSEECETATSYGQSDPPNGTFRAIAVGKYNACAIRTDGTLACWGAGSADDCVGGSSSCRQSRPPAGSFEQVALGTVHGCAMNADRKIECWGYVGSDGRTIPPDVFQ
jgi:hypothetical protein